MPQELWRHPETGELRYPEEMDDAAVSYEDACKQLEAMGYERWGWEY